MEIIYKRKINYYETDKMGIVHHANYIKYFEEARIFFLDSMGLSYKQIEAAGIIMPVLGLEISYKTPLDFDDILYIKICLKELRGAKAAFGYEGVNEKGELVCKGSSSHGFVSRDFKPLILKKEYPEIYKAFSEAAEGQ